MKGYPYLSRGGGLCDAASAVLGAIFRRDSATRFALLQRRGISLLAQIVVTLALVICHVPGVFATSRTWLGNTALWSNPSNWSPAGAPQNGDSLTFPVANPFIAFAMNNDVAQLSLDTITFTGSGYTLDGNALTLNQGITDNHVGALNRVRCDIQFTSGGGRFNSIAAGQLEVSGTTTLANNQDLIVTPLVTNLTVSGVIQGNGGLVKRGEGALFLRGSGANTFTGPTRAEQGELHLAKTSAAQAISANVILDGSNPGVAYLSDDLPGQYPPVLSMLITNGGYWRITNGATVTNLVLFGWGVLEGSGLLNLRCDVAVIRPDFPILSSSIDCSLFLGDATRTFSILGAASELFMDGQIIGPGPGPNSPGITKRGPGDLYLRAPNIYFGPTLITGGTVWVYDAGALGGSGAGAETRLEGGVLEFSGFPPITVPESLVLDGGDIGFGGTVTITGTVVINDHCNINGASSSLLELAGAISGPNSFDVRGGTVRLSGPTPNSFGSDTFSSVFVRPDADDSPFFNRSLAALELAKPDNVVAVPTPVSVAGSGETNVAVLRNLQNGGVSNVSISHGASWLLSGHTVAPRALTFRGDGFVDTQGGLLQLTSTDTNQLRALSGSSTYAAQIFGNVACLLATIHILVDGGVRLNMPGQISGPAALRKEGAGTLRFSGNNNFTGPLTVAGGLLEAGSNNALGSTSAGTTVLDGGTLQIETNPALSESLTLSGAGIGGTNGALFLFPATGVQAGIVLDADATVRNDSSFAILSGVISGPGGLTKTGAGALQLGGGSGAANTYAGETHVNEGEMTLSKPANVAAIPGHLIIGSSGGGGINAPATTVRNFNSFLILGSVTVNRGGLWNLNGSSESFSVAALEGRPPLTLNGGGDVQTGAGTLTLPPGGDVVVAPGGVFLASAVISGNLALELGPHRFIVQSGPSIIGVGVPELDIPAVISQPLAAADIVKEGPGEMRVSSSNSFTGAVTVNAGLLTAANSRALGTSAGGTFVNSNASLALDGGFEVAGETLTLNSTNAAALLSLGPVTNTWSGNIVLQGVAGIRVSDARGVFTHFGGANQFDSSAISGPGGFIKSGPGAMFITALIGGNSYTGPTMVTDGLLHAMRRRPSLSDNITVNGANAVLRTGLAAGFSSVFTVLPAGASVTVQAGALWTMNVTNSETIGRLTGDGRLDIGTGATLTVSNSVSCTFTGAVSGTGALKKLGLASLRFTGQSPSYTGPATILDGTYKVDGYFANSPVTVKVSSVLRGSGAVGDVIVESGGAVRVDPRNPGYLGGAMQFNSVDFQTGGVLAAGFFGPDPTGGNDFLYVLNGVTLNSSALSIGFQYPPHEGDVITLVQKIAAGAVNGTFSSFPESTVRNIGQVPVVISYVGGNGNDVTLTVTNLPLRGGGSQLVGGSGGSALVPNDCSQLRLVVTNRGATTLSNLHATLRSLTEGVLVTRAESDFPNLAPNARGTNTTPFQIRTEPTFPCGGGVQLELVLTGSNIPPIAIPYTLPGASGSALGFDGRDDQVEIAANTFSGVVNNFTIELWANPAGNRTQTAETNTGVSGVNVPLHQIQRFAVFPDRGNAAYGATHVSAGLSIGRNGISAYEHGTNAAQATVHLPSRLVYSNALSGWTHVALVYANRRPQLYVNGALVRSSSSASLFANVHPSGSLGGSPQADFGNFDGQLDEVRIWNAALSQSQIQSNMTRSLAGTEPNLVTYFRCDEGGGSALTDSAPAGPNPAGTLTDGAAFVFPGVLPFGPDCNSSGGACESCMAVSGKFTTNTPTLSAPLDATGSPSLCSPARPCPGAFPLPLVVPFIAHTFANTSTNEVCATAQMHFECPVAPQSALHVAAYLGTVDPNNPCLNYLGDSGGDGTAPFSFRVPAGSNVVLLVTQRVPDFGCDIYSLELFGLPCPPPRLNIVKDSAPSKVLLQWSSAYPDFGLQSNNTLDGPGPFPFGVMSNPPALLNGKFTVTNASTAPRQFFRLGSQ